MLQGQDCGTCASGAPFPNGALGTLVGKDGRYLSKLDWYSGSVTTTTLTRPVIALQVQRRCTSSVLGP